MIRYQSSQGTLVLRCSICGAPLSGTQGKTAVECAYCGTEHRLVAEEAEAAARDAAAMQRQAQALAAELEPRIAALQAEASAAVERGDHATALRRLEGVLRLSHAPTIQLYQQMDLAMPGAAASCQQALEDIDRSIEAALRQLAGDWGVPLEPDG